MFTVYCDEEFEMFSSLAYAIEDKGQYVQDGFHFFSLLQRVKTTQKRNQADRAEQQIKADEHGCYHTYC